MSDIKDVLDATKKIESLLEKKFGGSGRSLHAKLNNSTRYIPEHLVKRIRSIAATYNKAVNEASFDVQELDQFLQTCRETAYELEHLPPEPPSAPRPLPRSSSNSSNSRTAAPAAAAPRNHVVTLLWVALVLLTALLIYLLSIYKDRMTWKGASTLAEAVLPSEYSPPADPGESGRSASAPASSDGADSAAHPGDEEADELPPPAEASGPVDIARVSVQYGGTIFQQSQAKITLAATNHTAQSLSQLELHARLFLDGEESPAFNDDSLGQLTAPLGIGGLPPGKSRTVTVALGEGDAHRGAWLSPQALAAQHRRVEVAVTGYTDATGQRVQQHGSYVSSAGDSGASARNAAASAPGTPASAPAAHDGSLQLEAARLTYVSDSTGRSQAQIRTAVYNGTDGTVSLLALGARVFINGQARPALELGPDRAGDTLMVPLGSAGLAPGERREISLSPPAQQAAAWTSAALREATSRRLELYVVRYTDGQHRPVEVDAH